MKKLSYFIVAMLFAVSAGFVSCETEDSVDPTIDVKLNSKAINSGDEISDLGAGAALTFDVDFRMGSEKLTNLSIKVKVGTDNITVVDSVLNKGIFNGGADEVKYTYKTNVNVLEKTVTFSTTDKGGVAVNFVVVIKPKSTAGDYITGTATILGAQNNATLGSFYSVSTGDVLLLKDAKANPSKVDFAYYYGATNKATICGPKDADVNNATSGIKYGGSLMSALGFNNDTRFIKIDGSNDYDEWYDAAITEVGTSSATAVPQLAVGDYCVYKTSGGKTGAFKVDAITGQSNAGSITILLITKK
jgi:hypothetical protein